GHLSVVARLVVAPNTRRRGIGRLLLGRAATEAADRGLVPILDVVSGSRAAIALYERAGWTRLGEVSIAFQEGPIIEESVYVAPGSQLAARAGRSRRWFRRRSGSP